MPFYTRNQVGRSVGFGKTSRTNLVTNGGVETNTTGWGTSGSSTIARSTDQAAFGTQSLKITYVDNRDYAYYSLTLSSAGTYTQSISVYIPTDYDGSSVGFRTTNFGGAGDVLTLADMSLRDQWQRLSVSFTVSADLAGLVGYMRADGTTAPTSGKFIYVDGLQVELAPGATPYIETDGGEASATYTKRIM